MDQAERNSKRLEYRAKAILMIGFFSLFAVFIGTMSIFGPGLNAIKILSPIELTLLALSTYRLGRLVAYDRVFEPFRHFFTETVPDPTGEGETINPKGEGFQQSIGQLLCCPICAGTWIAAVLTYALYLFPGPMFVFLSMTAAIGVGELLNALTESLSWSGQYSRTKSGAQAIARREREEMRREMEREALEREAAFHYHETASRIPHEISRFQEGAGRYREAREQDKAGIQHKGSVGTHVLPEAWRNKD